MNRKIFTIVVTLSVLLAENVFGQSYAAPELNCVYNLANGDVQLEWSNPSVSCGAFNAHNIYYSAGINGPYSLLASEPLASTSFVHTGANGFSNTYYYYMQNDYNCAGWIALRSDTIDNLDPLPPILNVVRVTNHDQVYLYWYPSFSPEAAGYIIYLVQGAVNIPIDTVYDPTIYEYIDSVSGADPRLAEVAYTVAAFDSCWNTGNLWDPPQHTILLNVDTPGICDPIIHLEWTAYDGWPGAGVGTYHVQAAPVGGSLFLAATLSPTTLSYDYNNVNEYDHMWFVISPISIVSGWIAGSNADTTVGYIFHGPENFYIRNVSVISSGQVDVFYSMDPGADVSAIVVERSNDGSNFSQIATIPISSVVNGINTFSDVTAEADQYAYCYRLSAVDGCGNTGYSSTGCSILLTGYAFSDGTNHLDWNASDIDFGTSNQYTVYKESGGVYSPLSTTTSLSYEEVVTTDSTCYYVESENHMVLPNGIDEIQISKSNIKCLIPPSAIYLPNAFSPEGTNNIFMPVFDLHGTLQSYSFSVFNRWGAQLFTSADADSGWDGKFNGKLVPQGAYAYLVKAVDASGQKIERKGTVMVLR